jgi:two-component system nitrate/nitrite response regulator NarL
MHNTVKPIRVMIIDDHRTVLWGLERLIESESPRMEVIATAGSSSEALAQIRKTVPDVILLDLDLSGKSGLDLLPALLANLMSQVLILTGTRDTGMLDSAVLQGARGVLRKDAPADQVLKAIEKVHRGELWLDRETLGRVFGKFRNRPRSRYPSVMPPRPMHQTEPLPIIGSMVLIT